MVTVTLRSLISQNAGPTVDGSEFRRKNQLRLVVYTHYVLSLIHPRWWFGISSINSRTVLDMHVVNCLGACWNVTRAGLYNPGPTLLKINMEHNSLEVWFRSFSFLFMGDGCRFQPLIFQGVVVFLFKSKNGPPLISSTC